MVFTAANGNWAKKFTILRDCARTAALALMHHEAPQILSGYKNTENNPNGTTIKPIMGTSKKFAARPTRETWLK